MYVKKVNTKSPSLNSQLNDRLTRKGIPTTSDDFLMPQQAFYAFWIYVCQVNAFLRGKLLVLTWHSFLLHLPLCQRIDLRLCSDIRAMNSLTLCS